VKIRTSEGQSGNLLVYVVPRGGDPATCQVLDVELKPLNLHERIESLSQEELETIPLSKVTLKGRFQPSEALGWAGSCLPDVPHNVQSESESTALTFRSTLVGTIVVLTL